jgi:hypothetical protein
MTPPDSAAQAAAPHCAGLCAGVRFPNCRGASNLINYAAHLPHFEQTDTVMKAARVPRRLGGDGRLGCRVRAAAAGRDASTEAKAQLGAVDTNRNCRSAPRSQLSESRHSASGTQQARLIDTRPRDSKGLRPLRRLNGLPYIRSRLRCSPPRSPRSPKKNTSSLPPPWRDPNSRKAGPPEGTHVSEYLN